MSNYPDGDMWPNDPRSPCNEDDFSLDDICEECNNVIDECECDE